MGLPRDTKPFGNNKGDRVDRIGKPADFQKKHQLLEKKPWDAWDWLNPQSLPWLKRSPPLDPPETHISLSQAATTRGILCLASLPMYNTSTSADSAETVKGSTSPKAAREPRKNQIFWGGVCVLNDGYLYIYIYVGGFSATRIVIAQQWFDVKQNWDLAESSIMRISSECLKEGYPLKLIGLWWFSLLKQQFQCIPHWPNPYESQPSTFFDHPSPGPKTPPEARAPILPRSRATKIFRRAKDSMNGGFNGKSSINDGIFTKSWWYSWHMMIY